MSCETGRSKGRNKLHKVKLFAEVLIAALSECKLFCSCLFTIFRYATRGLYGYCPQWALNWEYRKKGILDEVRHYAADIIALQEVETDQFYKFFLPELKRDGYEGIFSPKSRAKTMSENDRKHVDGCAIFYRTSKFTLIKVDKRISIII